MGRYGKPHLLNEVRRADTKDLDEETTVKTKKWLNKNTLDQVKTESMAAACFHVWVSEKRNLCVYTFQMRGRTV